MEELTQSLFAKSQTKDRSVNFSKAEIDRLQSLIAKHQHILFCKKTDSISSKQKDSAWNLIECEFNALGDTPRTMKQLKYKFENLKRAAKKEASKERQEMLRTGGGPPPPPPGPDDASDWLRSVMSTSIDGLEAKYDDDVLNSKIIFPADQPDTNISIEIVDEDITRETQLGKKNESQKNIAETESATVFDSSAPHSSLRKPVAPQLKRMVKKKQSKCNENIIKHALKEKKLAVLEGLHELELEKIRETIRQQKELHNQLMQHNNEKHNLEMIKIQLEIDLLEEKKREQVQV